MSADEFCEDNESFLYDQSWLLSTNSSGRSSGDESNNEPQ